MNETKPTLFFCAIGGSGMLPLALITKAHGYDVCGSDRSHDQKRTPERYAFIERQGIHLFPQDGSGITPGLGKMVVSTAVEETVPDFAKAKEQHIPIVHRAELLAEMFNAAKMRIAIAGTSGKSTTTGMIGWILQQAGKNPTIMNGAIMKNFITPEIPFASARVGDPELFVSEVDESDGSIVHFIPTIAVLNNVALDHKTIDELRHLFSAFVNRAAKAVLNLDNAETATLAATLPATTAITYSLSDPAATLQASAILYRTNGVAFSVTDTCNKKTVSIDLKVPGAHNVSNALAALGTALALGIDMQTAAHALNTFAGMARRLDVVGTARDITVIDDFAHNPDKIAATLRTLSPFSKRLLIIFQPHGFAPLRLMRKEYTECFISHLRPEDHLFMPDPLYLGGTVNRSVSSADVVNDIIKGGANATFVDKREDGADAIIKDAKPGDCVLIMGARDDTLVHFARSILARLA